MKFIHLIFLSFLIIACNKPPQVTKSSNEMDFVIAFGSCNNQNLPNHLWPAIIAQNPDVWIWGGDIVYADTDDMKKLRKDYDQVLSDTLYQKLMNSTPIMGTWDDHDYGLNDGGEEFSHKKESQRELLRFLQVPEDDPRYKQEGVFTSSVFKQDGKRIKVIVLDTRYFRTSLTPSKNPQKRYMPNFYGEGTILGDEQWQWLEAELTDPKTDYNIVVSSIQMLSDKHGFETWGNFRHEVKKFISTLITTSAAPTIVLSGDRHISEISRVETDSLSYPLIDFTSSGMTHSYTSYKYEFNPYRVNEVVSKKSFGTIKFDFDKNIVYFNIVDKKGNSLGSYSQKF